MENEGGGGNVGGDDSNIGSTGESDGIGGDVGCAINGGVGTTNESGKGGESGYDGGDSRLGIRGECGSNPILKGFFHRKLSRFCR